MRTSFRFCIDDTGREIGDSFPSASKIGIHDILDYVLKEKVTYEIIEDTVYYFSPIYNIDEQIGVVQFQYSLRRSCDFYHTIEVLFYTIGTVVFLAAFIIGYSYFNTLGEGVLKLKKATEKIRLGQYGETPLLKRKDELGQLSEGIYFMSSEIEKSIIGMKAEEEKLRLAVEKLRNLEEQQREFIGSITHEFKTPLTVIKAYIDLIKMYPEDLKLLEDAKANIGKETERLFEMVQKILHLAALEKYDFEFEAKKVDIKEILQKICKSMDGKAQKFGLTLHTELQTTEIIADEESLNEIFINVIDNAIKYNEPQGKVWVKSYVKENRVYIEIKDNGVGIPNEVKDKIFQPFYTVNKDRSRQSGGTGLGLALVKQLVERHKGKIVLKNSKEKGSAFLISFPIDL